MVVNNGRRWKCLLVLVTRASHYGIRLTFGGHYEINDTSVAIGVRHVSANLPVTAPVTISYHYGYRRRFAVQCYDNDISCFMAIVNKMNRLLAIRRNIGYVTATLSRNRSHWLARYEFVGYGRQLLLVTLLRQPLIG